MALWIFGHSYWQIWKIAVINLFSTRYRERSTTNTSMSYFSLICNCVGVTSWPFFPLTFKPDFPLHQMQPFWDLTDITRLQQLIVESKTTLNIKHVLSNVVLLTDYLCMSFSQLANVRQIALYNKMNFTSIYFAFKLFYSVSKNTYWLPLKRKQNSSWIS